MKRSYKSTINLAVAIGILSCGMIFSSGFTSGQAREGIPWYIPRMGFWGSGEFLKNSLRLNELCYEIESYRNYAYHFDQWWSWVKEAQGRLKKFLQDPACHSLYAVNRVEMTFYWDHAFQKAVCTCSARYMDDYRDIMYEKQRRPEFLNLDPHKRTCSPTIDSMLKVYNDDIDWLISDLESGKFRQYGITIYPALKEKNYQGKMVPKIDKPAKDSFIKGSVGSSLEHIFYSLEEYYQHILAYTLDKYVARVRYFSGARDIKEQLRRNWYSYSYDTWFFFLDNFLSQTSKEDYYEAIRGVAQVQKRALEGMRKVGWEERGMMMIEGGEMIEMRALLQEKYEAITKWEQKLREFGEVRVITSYPLGITYTGRPGKTREERPPSFEELPRR